MYKTLDLQCKGNGFDSRAECAFFWGGGIFFSTSLIIHTAYIYAHRAQRVKRLDMGGSRVSWHTISNSQFAPHNRYRIVVLLVPTRKTLMIFLGKLGAIYGRLNLISKPQQIFNVDETGVSCSPQTRQGGCRTWSPQCILPYICRKR